jgi:hypothetical protein
MLVAFGAEYGNERQAGVAPQIIGNIETAIGCGTVTHGNGVAIQAVVGDAVYRGDVIETAADGRIGIRFIDGTAFKIPCGTRVVLGALPAGQAAKTGSLGDDAPAGSTRGRVHTGGFALLSLLALIFPMLKEAQAADSDVTLLDDDNITYKDREHGSFELITKEAIPRHIIVEDPGETVIVKRIGSSVSVTPGGNSAARMEELQVAQQDALANWDKGLGQNGSSAYPFLNPELLPQPINFIQTDDAPQPQNVLVPLGSSFATVPDLFIVHPPTLAITSIGGQIGVSAADIINASEANAGVEIVGTTTGVLDGGIVTVTIVDSSKHVVFSGTTTVANGAWLINLTPAEAKSLADGTYTLTADVSNAFGDPADATRTIRVDETPPTIAIDPVARHDVVNANAASTGFAIAGTVSDAEDGQPVTVRIIDGSGHIVDTFTTALTNSAWSVNVSSAQAKLLHDGSYTVTADVSDTAGNPAPEAKQTITVDETPPTVKWLPQAESGVEGTTIALGAITAMANSLPGHSNSVQSLVVSGIPVGAVLTDCTNSFTATSGNTSIDVESWNLSKLKIIPPNDTNFTLTVTATDQDANTASASELVKVAPIAPDLDPVAAHGNEDTAIALDLGAMARSLSGVNGDAFPNSLNTLVVGDIPVGATLSDGTGLPGHSFTATINNTSYDVAGWNLSSLKITPPAEFEGCFTLKIAASERDSEGDISTTVTACEVVKVAPVADPPTASAPATLTLNENSCGAVLGGVSVGPLAEDNDDTVSAMLMVSHGELHVGCLSGVMVTGDGSAKLMLSGSAAAVNTLLAELTYKPTAEYEGCDTLHLSVTSSDGSSTYPTAASASTAITVNPVARPPTASAPETLTFDENSCAAVLAGVRVGPLAEDNDDTVSATLAVSHGTLDVGCLSGVSVTGDDSATLMLSGSAAAVNSLLAGLTYRPAAEYEGCDTLHLSVTSTDGSNTYPTAATASTAITVSDPDVSYSGKLQNDVTLAETANATFTSVDGSAGTEISAPPTASGTVTVDSGATGEIAAASAATIDFADASGTNTSAALDNARNVTGQFVGFTGDGTAGTLSTSETATTSPTNSAGGFEPSSTTLVGSGDTGGAPEDSFQFKGEISGIRESGITDVANPNHTAAPMDHLEDVAGTHGPSAISEGGETSDTLGNSFHFKDEISSFKGSGPNKVAELNQIPASIEHHSDGIAAHGLPAISGGAEAIELAPPGLHPDDHFTIVPDHTPSALVAHVLHDLIV